MATVGELLFRLRADTSGLDAGISRADQGVQRLQQTVRRVGDAGGEGARGLGRIERAMSGIAISAAGVDPHLGHLSTALLAFGAGGAVTVAVLAGAAVIGTAWKALEGDAAELAKTLEQMRALNPEGYTASGQTIAGLTQARQQAFYHQKGAPFLAEPPEWFNQMQRTVDEIQKQVAESIEKGFAAGFYRSRQRLATIGIYMDRHYFGTEDTRGLTPDQFAASSRRGADFLINPRQLTNQQMSRGIERRLGEMGWPYQIRQALYDSRISEELRRLGADMGAALLRGILEQLAAGRASVGSLIKSLFLSAAETFARIGITAALTSATGGGGAIPGGAGFVGLAPPVMPPGSAQGSSPDFSSFPAATNPLAAARDAEWIRFYKETALVAERTGFRLRGA